jgi:hypothetical protein
LNDLAFENNPVAVDRRRIRYVCMPGSPFTGSTLLGLLLNEHPQLASIGAATGLIRGIDVSTYACSCGKLFQECEFWTYVATRTRELGHPVNIFETNFWNTHLRLSHNKLINGLLVRSLGQDQVNDARDAFIGRVPGIRRAISETGWNTWSLATAVLERTGKRVFVDTARDHQRPKYLWNHPLLDVKVIHLIRDPRGNSASIMKHANVDAAVAARDWRHYNVEAARVKRYLPPQAWMTLYYEELCADPGKVLDRISDFLDVERAQTTPGPGDADRHIIGNPMRLKALSEIREDRSWQTHLDHEELSVIARIAGSASRDLGYNWP